MVVSYSYNVNLILHCLVQSMGASPGSALGVGVGVGVGGTASAGYVPVSVVEAAGTRGVVLGWRAPPPSAAAAQPGGPPQPHHHAQAPPPAPPPPHPHPHAHHHALQLTETEWPPRASLIAVDTTAILPVQVCFNNIF